MKRALILLTVLGLAFSPLMVSQAQAAPTKQHAKHQRKHARKKAAKKVAHHQARRHKTAAV